MEFGFGGLCFDLMFYIAGFDGFQVFDLWPVVSLVLGFAFLCMWRVIWHLVLGEGCLRWVCL